MRRRFRSFGRPSRVPIALLAIALGSSLAAALVWTPEAAPARPAFARPVSTDVSAGVVPVVMPPPEPIPVDPSPPSAHWVLVTGDPGAVHRSFRVPILMYHRVVEPALAGKSAPELVVPPSLFAAQMTALRGAGWRTIDTATLAADIATGRRPPPRSFVISFDDGYADGYTEAFRILQRLDLVATYYIVTGRLGWADRLTVADVQALAAAGMEIGDH